MSAQSGSLSRINVEEVRVWNLNFLINSLKEMETQGKIAALETKLAAIQEMIEENV